MFNSYVKLPEGILQALLMALINLHILQCGGPPVIFVGLWFKKPMNEFDVSRYVTINPNSLSYLQNLSYH